MPLARERSGNGILRLSFPVGDGVDTRHGKSGCLGIPPAQANETSAILAVSAAVPQQEQAGCALRPAQPGGDPAVLDAFLVHNVRVGETMTTLAGYARPVSPQITVNLPDASLVDLLIAEIRQVDGVAVEDVRPVSADRPDGSLAALSTAAAVVAAAFDDRLRVACESLRTLLDADWAVALCMDGPVAVAHDGEVPELEWLAAFLAGSEHLDDPTEHTPGDLVWCRLPKLGVALACGRAGRVFHAREREEFRLLGGIADAVH